MDRERGRIVMEGGRVMKGKQKGIVIDGEKDGISPVGR